MEKYPLDLLEFNKEFGTEEQCLDYLLNLRWSDEYSCPRCECNKKWDIKEYKYKCRKCGYQTSVTAGTLFQDTQHKLLPLWFRAIWYVTSQAQGTSAFSLQKILKLGSYRTAWTWLYKLRGAMNNPKSNKLQGTIEFGMSPIEWISRGAKYEVYVVSVIETNNGKYGRLRMGVVDSPKSINSFIENNVELGTTIIVNDGLLDLFDFSDNGYIQKYSDTHLLNAYKFIFLIQEWMFDKIQRSCSKDHIAYYLDEYCFKFNGRDNKMLFYELLQNAIESEPIPYKDIVSQ